jgi:membrane-bound serine protease (ClpP class)
MANPTATNRARPAALVLILCGCLLLAAHLARVPLFAQSGPSALLADIDGAIGPATSEYVSRTLAAARARGSRLVILRMDTPGGLATSMREIIQDIIASPVPVAIYVSPSGARAASAGTYMLYASHIAAMAPGTNLGAATPVQIGGGGPPSPTRGRDKDETKDEKAHPTIADKTVNDSIAYIRSLAQMRGRNVEWAERAVREAASLSAEEAAAERVIDLVATNLPALLEAINGRTVKLAEGEVTLATSGMTIERYEADWRIKLLATITDPNLAYILMLVGIYGLIFEFYSPGAIIPGVAGGISLLLALYAFNILPVNFAGLALLLLGMALIVAEAFVPSFGVLGFGGIAAFTVGSIMLMDTDVPGFTISPLLIGTTAAMSSLLFLFVLLMVMRSRKRAVVSGPEELIGSRAIVIDWDGGRGRVRAHGEVWQARAAGELEPGSNVAIRAIDGLTLVVGPSEQEQSP